MIALVKLAVKKTGCRNVCLAGGVALNSKANGKILVSGLVDNIFVQPAASDDGVALGAALAPYLDTDGRVPMTPLRHTYLGPESTDEEIEKALVTYKLRATSLHDPAATAAEIWRNGKILGWFQGRMEFGPRALGARSILADPRDPEMNAKVNNAVKFREWWRPFAPALLGEAAPRIYGKRLRFAVHDFHQRGAPGKTRCDSLGYSRGWHRAPANSGARFQSVYYWNMIQDFGRRTGVPVVMNTSFNLRGEPIVYTPTDAIRTFFSSGMDAWSSVRTWWRSER